MNARKIWSSADWWMETTRLSCLRRSDFAPLDAKTIARIERGEVSEPHADTIATIAKRLRVKPEEIQSY